MKITDELLSAYIDDALSAQERERVAAAVAADPALAERVAALNQVDAMLRSASARIDAQPMPAAVEALLRAPSAASDTVVPFTPRRREMPAFNRFAVPIAASVALAIGLFGGRSLAPVAPQEAPVIAAIAPGSGLHRLLETGRSGSVRPVAANVTADVKYSFQTSDGDYCRELDITDEARLIRAVACREPEGDAAAPEWRIRLASVQRATGKADGYQTAAAGDDAAFDGAVTSIMSGDALSPDDERRLILSDWQRETAAGSKAD